MASTMRTSKTTVLEKECLANHITIKISATGHVTNIKIYQKSAYGYHQYLLSELLPAQKMRALNGS